jgi:hypothetical protein
MVKYKTSAFPILIKSASFRRDDEKESESEREREREGERKERKRGGVNWKFPFGKSTCDPFLSG